MSKLIAIVDDEQDIRELITVNLKKRGFEAISFCNGHSFIEYAQKTIPDLVVLDLMLPGEDGYEICRQLRSSERLSAIPILMLTARADESDKVLGLELGADDYVTKPFSPKELIARINAILRRTESSVKEEKILTIGKDITINTNTYEVTVNSRKIDLTTTEFNILFILAKRPGWVYSRRQILERLWGNEKYVTERTIDVHIRHLRDKLGKAGKYIKNIRGVGYKVEI